MLRVLWIVLLLKFLILAAFVQWGAIGLSPDEAQYWTWSRELSLGYYSKPPGIAWQIAAGTLPFGNTELGVRFGSLVLGTLLSLSVYRLARVCGTSEKIAALAALAFALSPIGVLSTFLAITDVGMALFWTLAVTEVAKGLQQDATPDYRKTGIYVLLGALFKWPIYWLWAIILALMPFFPRLKSRSLMQGVRISLLALLPVLFWNSTHNWVTFRHVGATLAGGHGQEAVKSGLQGNFFDLLGAQSMLMSPIFFVFLLIASLYLWKKRRFISDSIAFCHLSVLLTLGVCLSLSLFMKIQGNWCSYVYPTAFVCTVAAMPRGWYAPALSLAIVLSIGSFAIPYTPLPWRMNPFKHNLGWTNVAHVLQKAGYNPNQDFLVSDTYQLTSELSFYAPMQKRAYFLNLDGARLNQFSFWPSLAATQMGNNGFFAHVENAPHIENWNMEEKQQQLEPYFERVAFLGRFPLWGDADKTMKALFLYRVEGYNGKLPPSPHKF